MAPLLAACGGVPCETKWEPGTLLVEQIDLPASSIGEATLVIGPDGTSVLIDVGNDSHDDDVREALEHHGIDRPDHILITHDDQDHIGALDELQHPDTQVWRWDTPTLPVQIALGDASLVLFLGNGRLAVEGELVSLSEATTDNAKSLGGVLSWGDFDYVFAGDLTGGGKDTPDVEGAVAARADALPWVPSSGVELMHVNHHGISSSTSEAWANWLKPRVALVGANKAYMDAPSPEALEAMAPWVDAVWVTRRGLLGNTDDNTTVARGPVRVLVQEEGTFDICGTTHTSTP